MANLIQLLNKNNLINEKIQYLINRVYKEYEDKNIQTETELFYKLKLVIQEFINNINQPLYKHEPILGTANSKKYNKMLENIYNDFDTIYKDINKLIDVLNEHFTIKEHTNEYVNNKLTYIYNSISEIENKINKYKNKIIFTEFFNDTDNFNYNKVDIAANVDNDINILTLPTKDIINISKNCNIEIMDGSNGYPGNTHIVDIIDNNIIFQGQNNLHIDLNDIIDENKDTWFEYELFNMSQEEKQKCKGYGLKYKENYYWVTNDNKLTLNLKLSFNTPSTCNMVTIEPYIPNNKNAKAGIVKSITVVGVDDIVTINLDKEFNTTIYSTFKPIKANEIIISFEQPNKYLVDVGHIYNIKTNTIIDKVFYKDKLKDFKRVEGYLPSIKLLGFDIVNNNLIHPKNYSDTSKIIDSNLIKQELFNYNNSNDLFSVKSDIEVVNAFRYCIGIKNINVYNMLFEEYGEYVSNPFDNKKPIKSITLEANEIIPKQFNDLIIEENKNLVISDEEYNKKINSEINKWIKYMISFDDGETWYDIYPKHRCFQGACTYKINDETDFKERLNNAIYLSKIIEPTNVILKIVLSRPSEYTYMTPIVKSYKLVIETGDDSIDKSDTI